MSELRRIALTGGFGFLGWHTACRLRAVHGIEPVRLGRNAFADPDVLREALRGIDTVIHLAGVNRADSDDSRDWGTLPHRNIIGEAFATYWPLDRLRTL